MSYTDVVICIEPDRFLETWPHIYRGQERTVRDRLRVSQVDHHVYSRYTPCLTNFTFEFIRRPIPPILSPSSRTFVELTLVSWFFLTLECTDALRMLVYGAPGNAHDDYIRMVESTSMK
jgi:hypothetical protein